MTFNICNTFYFHLVSVPGSLPEKGTILFQTLNEFLTIRGLPFSTYASSGGWVGSSLLYISIAYYMQKGGGWVQIACKIVYVLNGRPLNIGLQNKMLA